MDFYSLQDFYKIFSRLLFNDVLMKACLFRSLSILVDFNSAVIWFIVPQALFLAFVERLKRTNYSTSKRHLRAPQNFLLTSM